MTDISTVTYIAQSFDAQAMRRAFVAMKRDLDTIGVHPSGVRRFSWTSEDAAVRQWFIAQAELRGMEVTTDRNGNLRAWWGGQPPEGEAGVVTGSHLDSVVDGGTWDGPLGVLLGFLAVDVLAAAEEKGQFQRRRSLGVVDYMDEEGTRFGVACLGSKLMSGALDPVEARFLTDSDGISLEQAMANAGADPDRLGRDDDELRRTGRQVEVHIEQGRQLDVIGAQVAVASEIWPHGRWSFEFCGLADHAGTAQLADRKDASIPFAATVLAARATAVAADARATFGRFQVEPGGANVVPARLTAILDARAATDDVLEAVVADITAAAQKVSVEHGVKVDIRRISYAPGVDFDRDLRNLHGKLAAEAGEWLPEIPTQAGHDSGILAAVMPTSMLFVRSGHGISHSPLEDATLEDVMAGLRALVRALGALVC